MVSAGDREGVGLRGGTVLAVRLRRSLTALLLIAAAAAATAPAAFAQVSLEDQLDAQTEQTQGTDADGLTPSTPAASETPPPVATTPAVAATTPAASTTTGPAAGTPVTPVASTPTPPVYLVPGPDAASQPISTVVVLTEPDIPWEQIRIASLIAALLAVLLIGSALLMRNLGLRSLATPVEVAPRGRFSRLRERPAMFADDLRDFLRRDR
jgi:hypothetical protein